MPLNQEALEGLEKYMGSSELFELEMRPPLHAVGAPSKNNHTIFHVIKRGTFTHSYGAAVYRLGQL